MADPSTINLIKALHHIWNTGDLEAVPEVYSENFVGHWPKGWGTGDIVGLYGVSESIKRSRDLFPDWNEEIEAIFESGNRVVTRYRSSGTPVGIYLGSNPTGKKIEFQEISIFRIDSGKVIEQ